MNVCAISWIKYNITRHVYVSTYLCHEAGYWRSNPLAMCWTVLQLSPNFPAELL